MGQGMNKTILYYDFGSRSMALFCKDLELRGIQSGVPLDSTLRHMFRNCILNLQDGNRLEYCSYLYNCLVRNKMIGSNPVNYTGSKNNTFQNLTIGESSHLKQFLSGDSSLAEYCNIYIPSATELNNYKSNYHAFVGCRFKIGAETEYKALIGTTEIQLRNNFKARCEAQGFTVPNVTDNGEILPMGCWVFANDGTVDGYILKGSIVADFQTRRFKTLGHSGKIVDTLPISTALNAPFSFNPNNPKDSKIVLNDDSISLDGTVDISKMTDNSITSSVGMLSSQGLSKLTTLDVLNTFSAETGVRLTGDRAFGDPVTKIEPGINYLLRSNNEDLATVVYNGEQYTSSLAGRNNIFRGVAGKTSFDSPSVNAKVYPVTDLAQQAVVDVRIVKDLPPAKITTGNLSGGYWYFVSSDNVNTPIGTIKYKGVDYPFGSSFLVDASDLTFKIGNESGNNLHLRRCWAENYDPNNTSYTDYDFWKDKQQPRWTKVVINDLRCLMKDDNPALGVMRLGADGNYVASGHPEFYNHTLGSSGYSRLGYPIAGKFCQIRLNISTYNAL